MSGTKLLLLLIILGSLSFSFGQSTSGARQQQRERRLQEFEKERRKTEIRKAAGRAQTEEDYEYDPRGVPHVEEALDKALEKASRLIDNANAFAALLSSVETRKPTREDLSRSKKLLTDSRKLAKDVRTDYFLQDLDKHAKNEGPGIDPKAPAELREARALSTQLTETSIQIRRTLVKLLRDPLTDTSHLQQPSLRSLCSRLEKTTQILERSIKQWMKPTNPAPPAGSNR